MIKTKEEIELMRKSCALASEVLNYAKSLVQPGITTEKIDKLVNEYIISKGAISSVFNYHGFPKSICTSLNSVLCHGVPNNFDVLKNGDIINIDVTVNLNGYHGDTSATFLVGEDVNDLQKFIDISKEAMMTGINICGPGKELSVIGKAIEDYIKPYNYSVCRIFCGHGIGTEMHQPPTILHYENSNPGIKMQPGMTFTVEPIIVNGPYPGMYIDPNDGWTAYLKDKNLMAAQFEKTILITNNGVEIL